VLTFDTPNGFNVYAASRLAWNPELDIDLLWKEWGERRYGADAERATRALRRSAKIAEGIFFVKGFSLLTHLNQVPHLATIDDELNQSYLTQFFPENAHYRAVAAALKAPTEATITEVLAEKDLAIALARESISDVAGIPELERGFRTSENAARIWREIAATYFRLRQRPFQSQRFEAAARALEKEARRVEDEQGRSWPVYPAARGVTLHEFIRQARERAKEIQ
jgi:hypothetical protein